jgi:hypothetical protein
MAKLKPREMKASEFVAESIEEEAYRLPPSEKAKADILLNYARIIRQRPDSRMVRVWEQAD